MNVTVLIGEKGKSFTSNQLLCDKEYHEVNIDWSGMMSIWTKDVLCRNVRSTDQLCNLIDRVKRARVAYIADPANVENLYVESNVLTYEDIKDLDFIDRIIICKHK